MKTSLATALLLAGTSFLIGGLAMHHEGKDMLGLEVTPETLAGTRWAVEAFRDFRLVGAPNTGFRRVPLVPPIRATGYLRIGTLEKSKGMRGHEALSTVDFNALLEHRLAAYSPGRLLLGIARRRLDWALSIPPGAPDNCDCGLIMRGRFSPTRFEGTWSEGGFATIEWGRIRMRRVG